MSKVRVPAIKPIRPWALDSLGQCPVSDVQGQNDDYRQTDFGLFVFGLWALDSFCPTSNVQCPRTPKARNVIAWANGPGHTSSSYPPALKARNILNPTRTADHIQSGTSSETFGTHLGK